jgi:predicted permease
VLGFTAAVTVVSALIFGCLPAVQSMTTSLGGSLRESRRDSGGAGSRRVRSTLVAVEVALAIVLLVGASLAITSFERLTRVSPGFDPRGILTFSLSLPDGVYKEDRQVAAFYGDLVDRLARIPGAVSSAAVMLAPVSTSGFGGTFSIEGRAESSGPDEPRAQMRPITPGYFLTLGIPIGRGRAFDDRDAADAPPVAIVSEIAARRFWPGEDPIGRRIRMHVSAIGGRQSFREIVGVVGDVKNSRLDQPAAPMVYLPHAQHPASYMALVIRTSGDPAAAQGMAADALRQADKTLVPLQMEPMEFRVTASRGNQRFRAVLLGLFAGSAFFLAIVGLYAVVSYASHIRRHEIGVRVALGASARDIAGMVVRDGMRPVLVGLTLGSAGAAALSGLMRTLVFGVRPFEPAIVAGVVAGFGLAATAACLVPAWRATSVDPTRALRQE